MHKPIQIIDLDLSFPHKTCFENFTCQIPYGSRIAIIGRNGSGKSSLLKMILSICQRDIITGYVPQIIADRKKSDELTSDIASQSDKDIKLCNTDNTAQYSPYHRAGEYDYRHPLSGGQLFNIALTEALSNNPDVLLLDEPTNHLDNSNRKSLIRMLKNYPGTLIIVSHDQELINNCTNTLWYIDNSKVHIFSGNYDDYINQLKLKRASIESELEILTRQKKDMHHKLMQEQQRGSKSKSKGEKSIDQRKWPTVVSKSKAMRAEETSGRKKSAIDKRKSDLSLALSDLKLPEIITPKFSIDSSGYSKGAIVQISEGTVGYYEGKPILSGIDLSLQSGERIAITGDNGSGKSTLIKAIMGDKNIYKTGNWHVIKNEDIGYLDQHYGTLNPDKTAFETISYLASDWTHSEVRKHLNDFLFRKNEEVNALINTLSGGEKARLSLAQIAAKAPKLLILDEITNNLDLETKEHVVQVLKSYPGAMIIISHDNYFLDKIGIDYYLKISDGHSSFIAR